MSVSGLPVYVSGALGPAWACMLLKAGPQSELFPMHSSQVHFQPIATGEGEEAAKLPASSQRLRMLQLTFWIITWYAFSICLTLYNKWLFTLYGLSFPLVITMIHFFIKLTSARLSMWLLAIPSLELACFGAQGRWTALTGFATAADVALSNQAFLYLTVTSYTIVKSSVPMWILAFSICFGLQKPRCSLLVVILIISCGVSLVAIEPSSASLPAESTGLLEPILPQLDPADELPAGVVEGSSEGLFTSYSGNFTSFWRPSSLVGALKQSTAVLRRLGAAVADDGAGLDVATSVRVLRPPPSPPARDGLGLGLGAELFGFVLVLVASLCGGFRWACSQMLLSARRAHVQPVAADSSGAGAHAGSAMHPFALVFGTAVFGEVLLIPAATSFELRDFATFIGEQPVANWPSCLFLSALGGFLAFFLLIAELRIVGLSSGLTLSIAGIFKEILTALASVVFLGEVVTAYKASGLLLCTVGIGFYNAIKMSDEREAAR